MVSFPEPTDAVAAGSELVVYLDFFRERSIEKVLALRPEERATSRLPSGWSPVELLHHLRHVERRWVEWGFLGSAVDDPWADEVDGRWRVPPGVTSEEVVEQLRAQGRRTREVAATHGLDEVGAPGPRWRGAPPASLGRILLHLVQEAARHLGQLDVVAELATGDVGE